MPIARKATPFWETTDHETVRLYQGDVLETLRRLPSGSVQCVITSPPYWGLRDYGTGTWEGGDPSCDHKETQGKERKDLDYSQGGNSSWSNRDTTQTAKPFCKCGAKRTDHQLGSEKSPDCLGWAKGENCAEENWEEGCHVCRMVLVFREVRRVLRDDGTLWLNYGDSYSNGGGVKKDGGHGFVDGGKIKLDKAKGSVLQNKCDMGNIKSGNLVGVPWRVALALQADGWILRQDIIWAKPSPMPECLDPSTQVYIRVNGWVSRSTLERVSKMETKPEILGPNGWVKILNVWKTMKPAMKLDAGRAESIICSPEHKFPVSHDNGRFNTEDKSASEIRATGYKDYLLYHPIQKYLSPVITEWEGVGLTGHLGYVLGLYAAEGSHDGGYRMKWTIHKKEIDLKAKFFKSLSSMGLLGQAFPDPNSNAQNLITVSDWLQRTIWTFIMGRDARTKRLNIELLLNSPEEFRKRLLEGYIDGDGSDREGGGWSAASASRNLRDDLSTLASSLGIITSKGYSKQTIKGYDKEYHSHGLWTPYFNRSTKKGTDNTYQILPRGRKMLEGEREMIDLEVEGGLFLIGDGLVTHNSVKNRCTKAHEYVFLFAKKGGYFCDMEAIRDKSEGTGSLERTIKEVARQQAKRMNGNQDVKTDPNKLAATNSYQGEKSLEEIKAGCNKRSVWKIDEEEFQQFLEWKAMNSGNKLDWWNIASESYPGAHFATFPSKLITPMIKAGTSEKGCCSECGAPWKRVIEENKLTRERPNEYVKRKPHGEGLLPKDKELLKNDPGYDEHRTRVGLRSMNTCANSVAGVETRTVGWEPTCECNGRFETVEVPAGDLKDHGNMGSSGWAMGDGSHSNQTADVTNERVSKERRDEKIRKRNEERKGKMITQRVYIPSIPLEDHPVSPCIVLDPFAGSGTTNAVCITLGRNSIGIELSKDYLVKNAVPRIEGELLARPSLAYLVPRAARKSTMVGEDITG